MRLHLTYVFILVVALCAIFSQYTWGKDYILNITERNGNKNISCDLQTLNGNRVLVCTEKIIYGEQIPVKKSQIQNGTNFLKMLRENSNKGL